jgi:3-(methylthio)propanoyl-CoA dehydrogenase
MRARPPLADTAAMAAQIEAAPAMARVRALRESFAAAGPDTVESILTEAARFADRHLASLNDEADRAGCTLEDGRVRTAAGHKAAWAAFCDSGWSTLEHDPEIGGQGLPLILAAAVQEVFDRACPAFGMLAVPQRSASKLIAAYGDEDLRADWLPRLASGEWGATICISEAEAGSDVARIRATAAKGTDGTWRVTGEKCWISYGDHDLTPRIGHCLLARTDAGLSLLLVPDTLDDGPGGLRNAIRVRRIEEKMGLHASPTCALGFEGATGHLLGEEGRGLAQLFVMITNMRLAVGVQGLGIASSSADIAAVYAGERLQGGGGDRPVPIERHADVQLQVLGASARVEVLRGLAYAVANFADLAAHAPEALERAEAAALVQWLLPILKTTGGEFASQASDGAIQVLGGAGYTREWPVEQNLRDARVLTIFEGTTGIQALDLLHRRLLRGDRRGYGAFVARARAACKQSGSASFARCLDALEGAAEQLQQPAADVADLEAGATAFLHLSALAATGWIAARLTLLDTEAPANRRLASLGRHWLWDIGDRARLLAVQATSGSEARRAWDGCRPA